MKKVFKISGIDCANCAAELERAINKLPEIKDANLNFMMGKLSIEAEDEIFEGAMEKVKALIKKKEPDAVLK